MNTIAVSDTHHLPYLNATVTAKRSENGNTTPVMFYDSEGNELGYTLHTNAKGFLCLTGTALCTKGVFVHDDAVVTAVMGDGSSTSWEVKVSDGTPVNDGLLYGRLAKNGEEFVIVDGQRRKLLHSANTSKSRRLSLKDLDDNGSPITQWQESQQVYTLSVLSLTVPVEVGAYTKTLMFKWDGPAPSSPNTPVNVVLKISSNPARYAQHVMVYNSCPYRITLKDFATGATIGNVNPFNGTLNVGAFFVEDAQTGVWFEDEDRLGFDWNDASNGSDTTVRKIGGSMSPDSFYHIQITDRTPELLRIVASDLYVRPVTYSRYSAIPVKFDVNSSTFTKPRRFKIWFVNADGTEMLGTMPIAVHASDGTFLSLIYSGTMSEFFFPELVGRADYGDGWYPVVIDPQAPIRQINTSAPDNRPIPVPKGCDHFVVKSDYTANKEITLLFDLTDSRDVRCSFIHCATPTLVRFGIVGAETQFVAFVRGDVANITVHNSFGLLYPVGDTECDEVIHCGARETARPDRTWIQFGTFNQQNKLVVNIEQFESKFNVSGPNKLYLGGKLVVDLTEQIPVGAQNVPLDIVIKPLNIASDHSVTVFIGHRDMTLVSAVGDSVTIPWNILLKPQYPCEYHLKVLVSRLNDTPDGFVIAGGFV